MERVGCFCLKNQGGFVTKLQFVYWDEKGNSHHVDGSGAINLGGHNCRKPSESGVPEGSQVSLYAFVVWGEDNTATQRFIFDPSSQDTAKYTVSGTTHDNELGLNSVGPPNACSSP
ncbi:MAG TPA: hypothetical protein VGV57_05540 [Thermoleophilaceae bacterium]|nr:hypothetical protein [Thermoleophilaceae bacterium]